MESFTRLIRPLNRDICHIIFSYEAVILHYQFPQITNVRLQSIIWPSLKLDRFLPIPDFNDILDNYDLGCDFTSGAARMGLMTVLQLAHSHDCGWNEDTCLMAAKHGHLDILQWARANGCPCNGLTLLYIDTFQEAARNGHLHVLQWAHAYDSNCREHYHNFYRSSAIGILAAANGDLNLLKWAHANKYRLTERTYAEAARNGHLEILKWARSMG